MGVFDGLDNLNHLNVHQNKITSLPAGVFDGLGNLEILSLGQNEITEVAAGVFDNLGSLRTLLLTGNRISELPSGAFKGLDSLVSLDLSGNPGATFAVIAELESRDDGVAVVVAHGAPGPLTVQLGVTGGTLYHELVTVAAGSTDSGVITVTPDGEGDVTVSVSGTDLSAGPPDFGGVTAASGETLTLATADLGATGNTPASGVPTIAGSPRVSQRLQADTSGITDANGLSSVSYSYQWLHSSEDADKPINGATQAQYTPQTSDLNKKIKLRVSFTDNAGYFESLTSAATPVRVGGL